MAEIKIGHRVEKSAENPNGWSYVTTSEINKNKPIVICLGGAGIILPQQANGFAKLIENLLAVQDLNFKDMPCDIYSVEYYVGINSAEEIMYFEALNNGEKPDMSQYSQQIQTNIKAVTDFSNNIINDILLKLITDENGNNLQAEDAAKAIRNVNFVTFCYGSVVQLAINVMFREKLIEMGYNEQEAKTIESQICVFQSAPYSEQSNTNQTTTCFISLNDREIINNPIQQYTIQTGVEKPIGNVIKNKNNQNIVYVMGLTTDEGGDEHRSEYYLTANSETWPGVAESEVAGDVLPVALSVCLRKAVNNSYKNKHETKEYIPVSAATFGVPCDKIMNMANTEKSSHKIAAPLTKMMAKKFIPGISRKVKTKDEK